MSKSLSNGTLSLRFMQNALRRQQQEEVELKRAEVKDENKWEVGQEIRNAWGIGQGTRQTAFISHESSYLPFHYSREHEDTNGRGTQPLGRRAFNKKGYDVSLEQQPLPKPQQDDKDGNEANEEKTTAEGSQSKMKPSSEKAAGRSLKSARDAIFSLSGVGTDLRSGKALLENFEDEDDRQSQQKPPPPVSTPSNKGFLKPAGIDEPAPRSVFSDPESKSSPQKFSSPDVIEGTRKKRSRERGTVNEQGKKSKKKQRKGVKDSK